MSNELVASDVPSKRLLVEQIERLTISADAKAVLRDLAEITVSVSGKLIAAGRRILAFVLEAIRRFPNTGLGLIAALVVTALIASVPFLGAVLTPFIAPLLIAFGIARGALTDIRNDELNSGVAALGARLNAAG